MRVLMMIAGLAVAVPAAGAPLNVVATTSSMGMLARVVGGPDAKVTVLAPPDRDPHYLLARPSMMLALRRADLVVAVGADLEVAWLPAALQSASNPKVLPGEAGYFEGATQLDLLEKGQAADRSRGDVHPVGNPHFYMDPERMAKVASALAERMAALDKESAARYRANAAAFAKAVAARVPGWKQQVAGVQGVLFFHKDGNYLADLLGVKVLGYVEPVPGVPPTAAHLKDLVTRLEGTAGTILYATYHPSEGPEFLARSLGWPAHRLQLEPPLDAGATEYLDNVARWVSAIASAKR